MWRRFTQHFLIQSILVLTDQAKNTTKTFIYSDSSQQEIPILPPYMDVSTLFL